MPSVTIRREDAVQRWPVLKKEPFTAQSTATARSASSSTTSGFLPPISSCMRFIVSPLTQAAAMRRPVGTEPVKLIASTSLWEVSTAPICGPLPITRFSTPGGKPARCRMSVKAQAEPGTSSAGLKTTVLPYASAAAIFHAGIATGKFQGVMMPTTPSGSRVTSASLPATRPCNRSPPMGCRA
jgi:hypothetical protein